MSSLIVAKPAMDEEKAVCCNTTAERLDDDLTINSDEILVTWDSPTDPTNPQNWTAFRKWAVTILTSLGGLVTLMSGVMVAPAQSAMGKDLSISEEEAQMALSIFVLAFATGPVLLAPLSELYGRRPVWILGSLWYILWNTVCGFARDRSLLIVARFMGGLGASAEFAIGVPVLGDCWSSDQRGKSFAIASFIPLMGPAVGPILGGVVSDKANWHWIFWSVSIFSSILVIVALPLFPETYGPLILARKVKLLNDQQDGNQRYTTGFAPTSVLQSLTRPMRLLATQPILQVMSIFLAFNFGTLYIVLSTFASMWIEQYNQSMAVSGLHYISLAIGYTISAQIGGPATDRLWQHLKKKAGGVTVPEYRIPLMIPGAILIPVGLFWSGWAAESKVFWLVTDIGTGVYGCGFIVAGQAMQAYILESYEQYSASALAGAQLLRGFAAFAFPIFAPAMYNSLGYGWGNSLLAFLFMAIGVPAPLILWRFGARLRAKGKTQS
ncbi:major facilitator superfamily transporter [Phlyctema vagabunda]|uniref:Major facilitator superfamily transporter n=1 Tax=Phlyctema vagabunda TaxID=108571 RepID=A0ABR4PMV6_9HELO